MLASVWISWVETETGSVLQEAGRAFTDPADLGAAAGAGAGAGAGGGAEISQGTVWLTELLLAPLEMEVEGPGPLCWPGDTDDGI